MWDSQTSKAWLQTVKVAAQLGLEHPGEGAEIIETGRWYQSHTVREKTEVNETGWCVCPNTAAIQMFPFSAFLTKQL